MKPAVKKVVRNGGGADGAAVGDGGGAMVKTAKLVITKLVKIRQRHRQMAKNKPQPAQPMPLQPITTLGQRPKPAAVVYAVLPRLTQPQ